MIKVLMIVDHMNLGGIQSYILNLLKTPDMKSFKIDFLIYGKSKENIKIDGSTFHFVTPRRKSYLKNKKELKYFFDRNHFDIVHMHESSLSYITPLIYAKKSNIPVRILHSHSSDLTNKSFMNVCLHNFNKHIINFYINVQCACSKEAAHWMFGKNNKSYILPNGIESRKFKFNERKRNSLREYFKVENKYVVLHVGRFSYPKNHLRLLDIFKKVSEMEKNAFLFLIGEGENEKKIYNKIHELNLENKVILTGRIDNVYDYMSLSDCFLMPSLFEGLPLSIVEAQSSGLPCIVSDIITQDVVCTDLVEYIPLNKNDEYWARRILDKKTNKNNRLIYNEILHNSKFDILKSNKMVFDLYREKYYDKS